MANELIGKADRAQLGVLLQELEPYMEARVQKFNSPKVRSQLIDGYRGAIEAATRTGCARVRQAPRGNSNWRSSALQVATFNADAIRSQYTRDTLGAYRKPTFVDPEVRPRRIERVPCVLPRGLHAAEAGTQVRPSPTLPAAAHPKFRSNNGIQPRGCARVDRTPLPIPVPWM